MNTKEQILLLSKKQHEYNIKHDMIIKARMEYERRRAIELFKTNERLTFSCR